jgi:hypothetical protein
MSNFLKTHERLILVLVALAIIAFGFNKYVNYMVARDTGKVTVDNTALQTQVAANQQLATQVQTLTAQYNTLVATVTAQNRQLASGIQTRTQATTQQQTVDQTLPMSDLANRWATLLKLPSDDFTDTSLGLVVKDEASYATVSQLELVPELQQNLADTNKMNTGLMQELAGQTEIVAVQKDQIDGLNKALIDQDTVCTDKINLEKAKARKSKLKWFLGGLVTGFIGGIAAHF